MVKIVDITDLIFPQKELTPKEQKIEERKGILLSKAEAEARKNLGGRSPFSPIALMDESHKLYLSYLASEGLTYDGERGF